MATVEIWHIVFGNGENKMTVALTIKIRDGVVLAADSAVTMTDNNNKIINIYSNGTKIFNLHKKLPIGAATWGAGNIGSTSIDNLLKDFRTMSMSDDPTYGIDPVNYSIKEVTEKLFTYLKQKYDSIGGLTSSTGIYVSGYSFNEDFPETWMFCVSDTPIIPTLIKDKQDFGQNWQGQTETINRIIFGFNTQFQDIMKHVGIEDSKVDQVMNLAWSIFPAQLITPFMPIQDAIDIADFLIQTTVKYVQYTPNDKTVGGTSDIAVITKHEGFKWISRKHFYDIKLNPKEA